MENLVQSPSINVGDFTNFYVENPWISYPSTLIWDNTTGSNQFTWPGNTTVLEPMVLEPPLVLEPLVTIDIGKIFIEPVKEEKKKKFRRLLRPE